MAHIWRWQQREKRKQKIQHFKTERRQCGWSKVSSLARRLRLKGFLWTHKPKTCRERKKEASERRCHLGQQVRGFSCNVFQNQRGLPVQIRVLQGAGKRQTEINQCNDYCDFKNDRNTYLIVVKHRKCGSTWASIIQNQKEVAYKSVEGKQYIKEKLSCVLLLVHNKILWSQFSYAENTLFLRSFCNQKDDIMNPGIITGVLRPSILRKNILCTHIL